MIKKFLIQTCVFLIPVIIGYTMIENYVRNLPLTPKIKSEFYKKNKEDIEVLIHPEGIVHSMVEFNDNSVIAQLSVPDMKIPIAHGLGFPKKIPSGAERLSLDKI